MSPEPGTALKSLRLSRDWSLTQAAEKTGVSKAMLGQIERGESSPTVATLWKIATGFNVPFSLFIASAAASVAEPVQRSGSSPCWQHNATMRVTPLFPFDAVLGFDMLEIELAAQSHSDSSAHEPGVIEHVVVTAGRLILEVRGETHHLAVGQGLRFQADSSHSYRNDSDEAVRFHSLIHYPKQG